MSEWGTSHRRFISIISFISPDLPTCAPSPFFFLSKPFLSRVSVSQNFPSFPFALNTPPRTPLSQRDLKYKKKWSLSCTWDCRSEISTTNLPHALRLASTCRFVHPSVCYGFPFQHKQPPPPPTHFLPFPPHKFHFYIASPRASFCRSTHPDLLSHIISRIFLTRPCSLE